MAFRLIATFLLAALSCAPAVANTHGSGTGGALQASDEIFLAGHNARTPNINGIFTWGQEFLHELQLPPSSTSRQDGVHPGYIEYRRGIERLDFNNVQLCGDGVGGLRMVVSATISTRTISTHYNSMTGARVPGDFYNSDRSGSSPVSIWVPIEMSVTNGRVSHRLSTNFSMNASLQDSLRESFRQSIQRAIQSGRTLTYDLNQEGYRRAAQTNPDRFLQGWANIARC